MAKPSGPAPARPPASPPAPRRPPGLLAWTVLAAIALGLVAAELALARRSIDYAVGGMPAALIRPLVSRERPYNLLERSLEKGRLDLDKAVPEGLAHLPDPYDSGANAPYRVNDKVFDLSYYGGRLYLYFGITPALTAFLPWHLLTGHYLPEWLAVAGFSGAGFLLSAVFLCLLWRRHFPEVGWGYAAAALFMLAAATTVPLIVARPRFWEVPVACAYALLMAAVAAGWRSCLPGRGRWACLCAAGLCAGLAVGSRPSVLPSALLLTAAAAAGCAHSRGRPDRSLLRNLAGPGTAAFLPLVLVGVGLGLYNYARFGDPLQFGQHYQLSSDNVHGRPTFSVLFLPDNLRLYLLSGLRWGPRFPFAWTPAVHELSEGHGTVEFVVGILPNLPVLLLALAAPLAWRGRPGAGTRLLQGLAAALAAAFLVQLGVLGLFYGVCNRYEVDFLPFLVLLACLGLMGLARALAPVRAALRRSFAAAFALVCAYSCGSVGCASAAWGRYNQWWNLSQLLVTSRDPSKAIGACRALIHISNGNRGYTDLGYAELVSGRAAEAVGDLARGVREDPMESLGHLYLGEALTETGDLPGALAQFRDAYQRGPDRVTAALFLGQTLLALGRPGDALPCLEDAAGRDPGNADAHKLLGRAYRRAGRQRQAERELRIVATLALANPPREP